MNKMRWRTVKMFRKKNGNLIWNVFVMLLIMLSSLSYTKSYVCVHNSDTQKNTGEKL